MIETFSTNPVRRDNLEKELNDLLLKTVLFDGWQPALLVTDTGAYLQIVLVLNIPTGQLTVDGEVENTRFETKTAIEKHSIFYDVEVDTVMMDSLLAELVTRMFTDLATRFFETQLDLVNSFKNTLQFISEVNIDRNNPKPKLLGYNKTK